jgi:hypothetical protein
MPSENTIYFYPGRGGHSHDGNNSSFIDTSVYSLFDFSWGEVGDPDRVASQRRNYNAFRDFVITTVNGSILEPSGLVLQPGMVNGTAHIISRSIEANTIAANTLTANEISANTITSNELAANFVLVNTIIASSDFNGTFDANTFALSNTGTDGWAITSAGDAVFTNGLFRGNLFVGANDYWYSNGDFALGGNTGIYRNAGGGITLGANVTILGGVIATSVATPGIDIDANGNLTANTFALYGNGAIVTSSGNFSVSETGVMSATGATISGSVTANAGQIAGWTIDGNNLTAGNFPGYITIGPTAYSATGEAGMEIAFGTYQTNMLSGGVLFQGDDNLIDITTSTPAQITISDGVQSTILSALGVTGGNITSLGELQGDYVNILGNGVYYNASNLAFAQTLGVFPISFAYRNAGGRYYLIANNDNATLGTINWTPSDRRIKENISPVSSDILNKFYSINVYEFNWNDKAPSFLDRNLINVGVVADELITIIPDAVDDFGSDGDEPNRWATVEYEKIVPYAIAAIQDLNSKIQILEARITEIEA